MQSFIKKTIGFAILFVVSNYIYLLTIQQLDWNFKKRIESLNLESPNYDIIVIGNSLAMDGIDTGLLTQNGYSSYNLSIAGASLNTNYIQLNEYLKKYNHKPEFVILGLGAYMNSFKEEKVHPVVDYGQENKKLSYKEIPMIKFKWIFKELIKKVVSKAHRDAYLHFGQLKFAKQIPDETEIDLERKFPMKKYQTSDLIRKILTTCTQNGIKLLIVELPGYKKVRHKKEFNCKLLDNQTNNGLLLDYNNIEACKIYDSNKDWIGNHHLNIYGAKKLTNLLIKDLVKIGSRNFEELECLENMHDDINKQ